MVNKIKVMIVDDSAVVRETLTSILSSDDRIEVIATAQDPIFAMKKLETMSPDVITLDIEMPRMDGISFLRQLRLTNPIPVVICSSNIDSSSDNALHAMEAGATDLILKPKIGTKQFLEESKVRICDVVKAAYYSGIKRKVTFSSKVSIPSLNDCLIDYSLPVGNIDETTEKIIVIGASTGGTEAIYTFLEMFPSNGPPMVIVQHMPEFFTASFADRLNNLCKMNVKEAVNGDRVIKGQVLIAPGNKHTLIKRNRSNYYVEVKDGPLVTRHRPSVDVLFRSAAAHAGKNAIGVIMTGMGDDGAKAMLEMKEAGAYNIAQNEESCVIFGMPAEAIKLGAVHRVLALKNLAAEVLRVL